MRYRLGLMLAIGVLGLVGLSASEAACRAAGEYRVTGPNSVGRARFTETTSDESSSSGTVVLTLARKQTSLNADFLTEVLRGDYEAGPYDGSCFLELRPVDPVTGRTGSVGGTLAFGGAVILFGDYEFLRSTLALNLTVGIRSDFLLRP